LLVVERSEFYVCNLALVHILLKDFTLASFYNLNTVL